MGSCKVYSREPLQIFINGFTKDREVHEATSTSQWHSIAINGTDPFPPQTWTDLSYTEFLNHSISPEELMVCPFP